MLWDIILDIILFWDIIILLFVQEEELFWIKYLGRLEIISVYFHIFFGKVIKHVPMDKVRTRSICYKIL